MVTKHSNGFPHVLKGKRLAFGIRMGVFPEWKKFGGAIGVGWPGWKPALQTMRSGAGTKKAPRRAAAPLQNQIWIGPGLLGLLGGFLVGLFGFLCHADLLVSVSR